MEIVKLKLLQEMHKRVDFWKSVTIDEFGGKSVSFKVKRYLSLIEYIKFVEEVVGAHFTGDTYTPSAYYQLFDYALCKYYTNLELPEDVEDAYSLIHNLGIIDKIYGVIGETVQYNALLDCIAAAQDYEVKQKTGINKFINGLDASTSPEQLSKTLQELKNFAPEQLEKLGEMQELASLLNNPREALKVAAKLFGNEISDETNIAPAPIKSMFESNGSEG